MPRSDVPIPEQLTDIWSARRAGRHTQGTAFGEGAVARVLSGYRYQGWLVRLLTLQRLLLVQSQPFFGSAGQLRNGDRVFVCSDPSCTAGAKRVLKVSSNAAQVCCGQPMDRAMYRAAEDHRLLGTLVGKTDLDVFVCIGCVGSVKHPNFVIDAADVDRGLKCPQCLQRLMVRFGTSRRS